MAIAQKAGRQLLDNDAINGLEPNASVAAVEIATADTHNNDMCHNEALGNKTIEDMTSIQRLAYSSVTKQNV